jgi:hypothetical protein
LKLDPTMVLRGGILGKWLELNKIIRVEPPMLNPGDFISRGRKPGTDTCIPCLLLPDTSELCQWDHHRRLNQWDHPFLDFELPNTWAYLWYFIIVPKI